MYHAFYQLTQKPFQLSADPAFFFQSTVHKRALAYMHYGLTQGEGFVVVTGNPGTGKTMLVKNLIKHLNKSKRVIGVMLSSQLGPDDTLRTVANCFGYRHAHGDKASLLAGFEALMHEKAREGKRLLLIVDEAHHLPKASLEALRLLTNCEAQGQPLLQVFLVGQTELKRTVYASDMEQLKQRIVSAFELEPLAVDETRDYIQFRMQTAGWQGKPAFSTDIFDAIHQHTAGIPRRINSLCDRLLLYGYLEELSELTPAAVTQVMQELQHEMLAQPSPAIALNPANDSLALSDNCLPSERLARLEQAVRQLQHSATQEKALLRKAILLQLDMDAAYSDTALFDPTLEPQS